MSATGRGAVRVEGDFYPTPDWVTRLIISRIDWNQVSGVEEPARGTGAIMNILPIRRDCSVYCHEISEGWDYLKCHLERVTLSITNPPYNLAQEFLQRSLEYSLCTVYLLRTSFLESEKRREFLSANRPTHLYNLCKRPSFVDVCAGGVKNFYEGGDVFPRKFKGCGWAFQKADAVKECSNCGGRVKAGTDATAYAWICWDKGHVMRDAPGIYFL